MYLRKRCRRLSSLFFSRGENIFSPLHPKTKTTGKLPRVGQRRGGAARQSQSLLLFSNIQTKKVHAPQQEKKQRRRVERVKNLQAEVGVVFLFFTKARTTTPQGGKRKEK